MTAAKGFKRLGIGIVVVVAAAFGALALLPFVVPADQVRDTVKAEIRAVTGLDPVLRGGAKVSLFPAASVSFGDVVLGDERTGEPALVAERLTARLRLLPLLIGRIEIADVALVRPRIAVTFAADGRSNWSRLIATLSRTISPDAKRAERLVSFSEIRITEGTIVVRDAARGIVETLSEVELAVAWPSISRSIGANGRFVWRNETVEASVSLNDLFAALTGERSGLRIRLAGAPFKLAFDGQISRRPALKVDGTLAADSASLRQALRWAGLRPLPGGGFGRFALKAQASLAGAVIALSNVNVELDGNTAEGVLSLTADTRPLVQGTLAAEAVDLNPYVSTFRLMRQNDRNWSAVPIGLDGLTGLDLDLRLSAARILLGSAKVGRTAVAANLRNGRMTISISESQAFGGVLQGSVTLAKSDAGADFKAQLQFTDVDLEPLLAELAGLRRLEGKGNLAFAIEGSGTTVLALTRTLNGQASLTAGHGTLVGVNVEQVLRQLQRRPLSITDFRGGRTPFDTLTASVKIAQGIATIEGMRIENAVARVALAGSASIPAREFDLTGTATLAAAAGNSPPFELPFSVQGRWDNPTLSFDAETLIRQSRASAPLLEAIKDRKTRDAVRSVIDQLTRGPAPAPTAVPPPAAPAAEPAATPPVAAPR